MRIAIQAENLVGGAGYQHAGVGRYSYSIIDHLLQIGDRHEWLLATTNRFEPPPEWLNRPNFQHFAFPERFRIWRGLIRTPKLLAFRADALFVLTGALCNHGLFRQAATIHDLFPFDHPGAFDQQWLGLMQSVTQQQILKSNQLFAVSENTKGRILERFPTVPESRIQVTPNGPGNIGERRDYASVDASRLRELKVPFDRYLFTLGTLEPRKNLPTLIEAMARLRAMPEYADVGLVIGGGKGWKESAIYGRVAELGLESAIVFLGYVDDADLPELFARSEAFVCASLDEGFGMPILEAMLYGTPVVSSDRGALPEVGGDVALYFDPMSIEAMVDALRKALSPDFDRAHRIAAGIERAKSFSWERSARLTLERLEALAPSR